MSEVRFTDNSAQVKEALENAVLEALEEIGAGIKRRAIENAPVDTGKLQSSITSIVKQDENAVYIGVPKEVPYGVNVEMGTGVYYPGGRQTPWVYKDANGDFHMTHGQRAQPFLKPAVMDSIPDIKNIVETKLKNA